MSALLRLEDAQARLLALAPELPIVRSGYDTPQTLILAQDLRALRTQPAADLSAMDGYAVCGDGPWERVGESKAGLPFEGTLTAGQCTRISTGAHMPAGSDRVLIQENAQMLGGKLALASGEDMPKAGQHVRKRGFEFAPDDVVLPAGTQMGPAQYALAIAAGHDSIPHKAAPKIAVLDSGDELAANASVCKPNQIPASNGAMLCAMLQPLVGEVQRIGPVPDTMKDLANALSGFEGDILITSGGASVGDHDLVQAALKDWGAQVAFWKVAIKPGKPLMVATRKGPHGPQVILGLPGNPVSSFVTAFLFALPLIRAALGDRSPLPKTEWRVADHDMPANGQRREFLRANCCEDGVRLTGSQDSSALLALASANCLIDRPVGAPIVRRGERIPIYMLRNR